MTQSYKVSVDNAVPFCNVYGGTQDSSSLAGPSRTASRHGIVNEDWEVTNGGDGFESQPDPTDPGIVYAQSQCGGPVRYDERSGEVTPIQPRPGLGEPGLRRQWGAPLRVSQHSSTRLYHAANKVCRSDDRGDSWKVISPDLTRQLDRDTLPVMGKVWIVDALAKDTSTTIYGNIVTPDESPLKEVLLLVGTDDGLIRVTEDGGATTTTLSRPRSTTTGTGTSSRTCSRARTWAGRGRQSRRTPRAPIGPSRGAGPGGGFPVAALRDLAIQPRERDLAVDDFGRGFRILDDYSPLRGLTPQIDALRRDLEAPEARLEAAGAPYTPNRKRGG